MLSVLSIIIYALVVLIAILLIALILVQPSKSGGFGSAFGGLGESVFGAHAMSHLSKLTVVLITAFFVLTLLLAVLSGHITDSGSGSVLDGEAEVQKNAPAAAPAEAPVAAPTAAPAAAPAGPGK